MEMKGKYKHCNESIDIFGVTQERKFVKKDQKEKK